MTVLTDNTASCATTADLYVAQQRRAYAREAAQLIRLGLPSQASQHMNTCLRVQARVSGIQLDEE